MPVPIVAGVFAAFVTFFTTKIGYIVAVALASLGIGLVTYTGFGLALDSVKGVVINQVGGLPADIAGLAALAGVDKAITILFSFAAVALTVKIGSNALQATRFKFMADIV